MSKSTDKNKMEPIGKWLRILLFLSNLVFVDFLSKRFILPPKGGLDFVAKNLGTLLVVLLMTVLVLTFFQRKAIIIYILFIIILAFTMAIT